MTANTQQIDSYFLLPPDWGATVRVGRKWQTTITTTKNGNEQRTALKTIPRRSIQYTCVNLESSETNYAHRKLFKYLDKVLGIPLWVDGTELSSAASATDMILYVDSHAYREFEAGGKIVIFNTSDPTTFEIATISSLDNPGEIALTSGLAGDWAEGTEVFPILPSQIRSVIDVSFMTDRYNQFEIMAEEARNVVKAVMTTTTTSTSTTTSSTVSSTTNSTTSSTVSTTSTSSTFSTTTTAPPPSSPSWFYKVSLTIAAANLDGDLTDYPVYVDLSTLPAGFHSHVNSDGSDIRVFESDGVTELPREVVWYDDVADQGELYFKANLSSSVDNVFYIFYGNSAASDYADSDTYGTYNVWTKFRAVYHFQTTSWKDSTGRTAGTSGGNVTTAAARYDGNGSYFDGNGDYITLGNDSDMNITSNLSIIADMKVPSYGNGRTVIYKGTAAIPAPYDFGIDNYGYPRVVIGNGGGYTEHEWTSSIGTNTWRRLGVAVQGVGNPPIFYKNGVGWTHGSNVSWMGSNSGSCLIGNRGDSYPDYYGNMDELYVAASLLSAAWFAADYDNRYTPGSFYSVGAEEST